MLNYADNGSAEYEKYSEAELDGLIDDKFGILLIVGCKATYERFAAVEHANIVLHEMFAETDANVYTRLIVSPELGKSFMLENYKKVIFLDTPPSDAAVCYINRRSKAKVYVPETDNRADVFSCVKSDRAVFGKYYNAIKSAAGSVRGQNVYAYFKALRLKCGDLELPQFVACLSVFVQLGLMTFSGGTVAVKPVSSDLERSTVYKNIEAWQK